MDLGVGHAPAPDHIADPPGEDEFDLAAGDLFVEAHRGEEAFALGGGQPDGRGETGAFEEGADACDLGQGQAGEPGGEEGGGDLADRDGLAMEVATVGGDGLDRMAEGVAVVEGRAAARLGFVLGDDPGLDLAAACHDGGEDRRVAVEQAVEVAFEAAEEGGVGEDAVLDDLGEAGAELAVGQGAEHVEVAEDEAGLVEGADEVFSGGEVDPDLAADGAVDLGEQGGGDLDEGDAAEVGGGDEAGEVAGDAAAEGDDEGPAFEAVGGELVEAMFDHAEAFGRFTGGDGDEDGVEAGIGEAGEGDVGEARGDVGVGDDGAAGCEAEGLASFAEGSQEAVPDEDGIASGTESHVDRAHAWEVRGRGGGVPHGRRCGLGRLGWRGRGGGGRRIEQRMRRGRGHELGDGGAGWAGSRRGFLVSAGLGLGLGLGLVSGARGAAGQIEDLLGVGRRWLAGELDPAVLERLRSGGSAQWTAWLEKAAEGMRGEYVLDLAALEDAAGVVLPLLEGRAETRGYASWLRARMDYFKVADYFRETLPKPPAVPGQPAPPPMTPTPEQERRAWRRQVEGQAAPKGSATWVPKLKPVFGSAGVPRELVWLAEIESSFDPLARSPAGAAGMFQLMPATARDLGLKTAPNDERLVPEKNAKAAASYLARMRRQFGDWPLALAAYNAGPGRVSDTLKRRRARTYDAIAPHLPAETQMYVPKLDAVLQRREGVALAALGARGRG